jgi:DNA adenine methylase
VSLFCGSCAVESKLTFFERRICNDNQPYLIEFLKGVQNGYELPEKISEEEYKRIRADKDTDKVLTGFVGFGCSFGGKWFGGFARNKQGTNYALQSKKSILKDMSTMQDVEFINKDYRDVELPADCVIYADPPYANTTGYGNEKFDSKAFWEYAREVSKDHLMYISEQTAPDDFVPIWEKPFTRTLDRNKNNQFIVTEKLFIHKSLLGKLAEPPSKQLTLF